MATEDFNVKQKPQERNLLCFESFLLFQLLKNGFLNKFVFLIWKKRKMKAQKLCSIFIYSGHTNIMKYVIGLDLKP